MGGAEPEDVLCPAGIGIGNGGITRAAGRDLGANRLARDPLIAIDDLSHRMALSGPEIDQMAARTARLHQALQ